jgi:hypothetical protein
MGTWCCQDQRASGFNRKHTRNVHPTRGGDHLKARLIVNELAGAVSSGIGLPRQGSNEATAAPPLRNAADRLPDYPTQAAFAADVG